MGRRPVRKVRRRNDMVKRTAGTVLAFVQSVSAPRPPPPVSATLRSLDIKREPKPKRRGRLYAVGAFAAIVLVTVALRSLKPAVPAVDRSTLSIDMVRRGTMLREVRAPGTLVPEQVRWITAVTGGRVEQIEVRPGARVGAQTVILRMSNPDVRLEALSAQQQLSAAEASLMTLQTSLRTQVLNEEAQVAVARASYHEAKRNADALSALGQQGLVTVNEAARARELTEQTSTVLQTETKRLEILRQSSDGQRALQRAQIGRLRAIVEFQQERLASMDVRAGADGQLQEMNLEVGQWVNAGILLAKVAQPGRLKAVLRVAETQGKDLAVGQPVAVDTRNGIARGRVARVDPSAVNGTVGVEVMLDGALPKGARSDLSVDGTIEVERLTDVLYVGRPAYGQAENAVSLFRVLPGGNEAARVKVQLGRSSVSTIEIRQGLTVGDSVIISDVSQWDGVDRIRLRH